MSRFSGFLLDIFEIVQVKKKKKEKKEKGQYSYLKKWNKSNNKV